VEQLSQEDIIFLDDGAKQIYNAYRRKFESEDWQQTVAWAEAQVKAVEGRELQAKSWDQVQFCRGQRASYMEIVNLEAGIENQFIELVRAAQAKQIADDEGENE